MSDSQPSFLELSPAQQGLPVASPSLRSSKALQASPLRVLLHAGLFVLTVITTTIAGGMFPVMMSDSVPLEKALLDPAMLTHALGSGFLFSFTLLTILTMHELGHYLACRYYKIKATLPYFIPVPIGVGTLGAFIRIKAPITSRRALFDIGIAGPLAGFVFAFPASIIGLLSARAASSVTPTGGTIVFNDPLLFFLISRALHLPHFIEWNPIWFASWVGLLATGLNLLPVGQLDGGHVIYSLFGRKGHRLFAWVFYGVMAGLAIYGSRYHRWYGGIVYVALLTVMIIIKHPPTVIEEAEIGTTRKIVAVIGLLVFILSFLPLPISAS